MNVAFDVDGTIDSFPREFQSLCSALEAAGHHVIIVTGVGGTEVTPDDVVAKKQYLASLGITMYSQVIVCAHGEKSDEDIATEKQQVIEENDIHMLFDNDKRNVKAAAAVGVPALLLWNSKQ